MKNIHVLPTDQPSRLYLEYGDGDLCLSNNLLPQTNKSNNQHIYITSDEEIKGNDYYIHNNRVRQSAGGEQEKGDYRNCKKIILTTDTTLIADGVQSISYHFLEWFVKNPTCEFVEIESWKTKGEWELVYKIIIPQEELKSLEEDSSPIKQYEAYKKANLPQRLELQKPGQLSFVGPTKLINTEPAKTKRKLFRNR